MAFFLPKFFPRTPEDQAAAIERKLMRREAKIGGQLFGPIPKGHQRQFFCLDEHTWVWHETWVDAQGNHKSMTTRYDVRPDGIIKMQDGRGYQRLTANEAQNLSRAARLYQQRIRAEYQSMLHRPA